MRHWEILIQDLRFTARTLNGSRGFALAAVLVTALGVGANTATFSVADFVLVRPLPFKDPHELVRLCEGPREGGGWGCMNQMSPANYRGVVAMSSSFQMLGAFQRSAVNLVSTGEPVRLAATRVTAEVLPLLGVSPLLGRAFDTTSFAADAQSVVINHALWQSQFGSDDRVLGPALRLDGAPYVVIGVMPAEFRFPSEEINLWIPLVLREADFLNRSNNYLEGVGRLKRGVSFDQARADLSAVATRLGRDHPGQSNIRSASGMTRSMT